MLYRRGVDAAGFLEPARVPAPVAAAGFAVPFGHAFPFFAVGADGAARFDRALERWSDGTVNYGNNVRGAALGARGDFFGGNLLSCGFFSLHVGSLNSTNSKNLAQLLR
jgi:hypothetical protein